MVRGVTRNEELVNRLFNAFNEQDWETFGDLLADDVVLHESGNVMRGPEEIIEHDKQFQEDHPEATITVVDTVASEDRVAAREEISAENLQASAIVYARVEDEELSELWVGSVD